MKKSILAAVGAAFISIASFASPAAAMPMHGISTVDLATTENVQYRPNRHVSPPRHHGRPHHARPRQICRTERVTRRGPHGRPIVRHVRVCR